MVVFFIVFLVIFLSLLILNVLSLYLMTTFILILVIVHLIVFIFDLNLDWLFPLVFLITSNPSLLVIGGAVRCAMLHQDISCLRLSGLFGR